MANAMNILKDDLIIYNVLQGIPLIIYEDDDNVAKFLKYFINNSVKNILKFEIEYLEKYEEWATAWTKWCKYKKGQAPKLNYHSIGDSQHLLELKVNHYRQIYWYWEKLKP